MELFTKIKNGYLFTIVPLSTKTIPNTVLFFFFYHPVHYMTWWHAPSRHKNSYGSLRTQYLRGGGERVCSKSLICWTRGSNRPPSPPLSPQRVTPRTQWRRQRPGASGAADITLVIKKIIIIMRRQKNEHYIIICSKAVRGIFILK